MSFKSKYDRMIERSIDTNIIVTIKNAGKTYDLELQADSTGKDFKQSIQEVTNIPPTRQKILIKGGKINDDDVISALNLNFKQPVMVLGTPDVNLPQKPVEKTVFLEDLSKNQFVNLNNEPSGLVNLGNTCYLNSSLQVLYQMDDIRDKLTKSTNYDDKTFVNLLKSTFQSLSKKDGPINPQLFLLTFRNLFPQFAEQDPHGGYKQQDAEECFSQILTILNKNLKTQDLFKLSFKLTSKCVELPDEPQTISYEDSFKLNCHIDIKTNFLRDGIINGLTEEIEKFNDTLQANGNYQVSKTITRLPKFLTVHFMRFFWRRDTQKKSKILRKVQFPHELDLAEVLDESIKAEKVEMRDKIHKLSKDNLDLVRDFKKLKPDGKLSPLELQEENDMKIESIKTKFHDDLQSLTPINIDTTTENISSVYELTAIITHAGSSADSGHYQSYVKDPTDLEGEKWWKFNDDKVSSVNREKIESLSGGGEFDSALILIYKGLGL